MYKYELYNINTRLAKYSNVNLSAILWEQFTPIIHKHAKYPASTSCIRIFALLSFISVFFGVLFALSVFGMLCVPSACTPMLFIDGDKSLIFILLVYIAVRKF